MNATTAPPVPQLPLIEHIEGREIRIDVERFAARLHVRLRPATVPVGVTAGPRVAIELDAPSARDLGHALLRHADALEVSHAA